MGGGGRGSGGGVDPAFPSAPVNPMNLPSSAFNAPGTLGSQMGYQVPNRPSFLNRMGQAAQTAQGYANAMQPALSALTGQPQQQQQQRQPPINFNAPAQPYIPPPAPSTYGY